MNEDNPSTAEENKGCVNCGFTIIEEGYPTPLCHDCRKKFIRYPIPKSILFFVVAIAAILVIALINFPKNLSAGIHLVRGKRAEKHTDYYTARQEFKTVIKRLPDLNEVATHLMVSSFYCEDYDTFIEMSQKLKGKNIEDAGMLRRLNTLADKVSSYFPSDSFAKNLDVYHTVDSIPPEVYREYARTHPEELYPAMLCASSWFDKKEYELCDSVLDNMLRVDGEDIIAFNLKTTLKRELRQFDSSHYYCDRILSLNRQSLFALASKARTFLCEKKDREGLDWAMKSYTIKKEQPYTIATLALAYHFNNNLAERDKLMRLSEKDSLSNEYMQYIRDIIAGKENFRN